MKRVIKPILRLIAGLLIVVLLFILGTGCAILLGSSGKKGDFSYLIVLGTKVDGTEPSPMLRDRIDAAAEYLSSHPDVIAVVTGYQAEGADISEAQCMYDGLTARGIEPERIRMEEQATTTKENFHYSLKLLDAELGSAPETVGVLSSEFHLLRSGMLARHYGIEAITVPAKTTDTATFITYFIREIFVFWYEIVQLFLG